MRFICLILMSLMCSFLLDSCSIQKRRYLDGYYINANKHKALKIVSATFVSPNASNNSKSMANKLTCSTLHSPAGATQKPAHHFCDTIILKKNRKKIPCKIVKENENYVSALDCSGQGNVSQFPRNALEEIILDSSIEHVVYEEVQTAPKSEKAKLNWAANWGFGLIITGLLTAVIYIGVLLLIIGFVLSIIGMFSEQRKLAIAGLVLIVLAAFVGYIILLSLALG